MLKPHKSMRIKDNYREEEVFYIRILSINYKTLQILRDFK